MSEHFDVAVVGGGIVGAAVAFHTARLGGRVVVLDSSPASGATGHSSAIVRVHQPDLALAPLSYLGWQEFSQWEDVVGRPSPFRVTGCVHDVSPAGGPDPADVGRLRTMGWRCSIVGAAELAARYRSVAWPAETNAVFEPDAGWADPVACRDQYLDRVEELGGSVRRGALVSDVIVHKDVVRGVHVAGGPVGADAVVLATGAWSAFDALGPAPALDIRARRIVWQRASGPFGPLPCFVREGPEALYFRPTGDGGVRFGVGCDDWDVAPQAAGSGVDGLLLERGRERIAAWLGLRPGPTTLIAAVDGYTADSRPVVDAWPAADGLYAALGFSGGGFKMAPAVGALLARWMATGQADDRLSPCRAARLVQAGST